jgi:small subunit ribosomal protein S16
LPAAAQKSGPFSQLLSLTGVGSREAGLSSVLGFFNPMAAKGEESLRLDHERAQHWINQGAQPSERVASFLNP